VKKIFIIVPSASLESPVRGACALANGLTNFNSVTLVSLKRNTEAHTLLKDSINVLELGQYNSWYKKLDIFKKTLIFNGGIKKTVTISIGLSADFFNSFCVNLTTTCSSVRGNLPEVYPQSFGKLGKLIAHLHLKRLRKIHHVVSMTKSMSRIVNSYIDKDSPIIGNFIDEKQLDIYRRKQKLLGPYKFVFVGALVNNKQPFIIIDAIKKLLLSGIEVELDVIGDGPLMQSLKKQSSNLSNSNCVNFHGFLDKPYQIISNADVLVLPSLTEGISRSVLEALYLGIPCVLREIKGSADVVSNGINGELFKTDINLAPVMLKAAVFSRNKIKKRDILTLKDFRQDEAVKKYIDLLNL
jgi:glycosyltransferase involved in cell wall biosynthesis